MRLNSHVFLTLAIIVGLRLFTNRWIVSGAQSMHSARNITTETPSERQTRLPVHVVHTRFMQHQGHLIALARARLELLKSMCLPTLVHQTSTNFLWIVKTDPNLDESVRSEIVELFRPHPHFFLVGSLKNHMSGEEEGSWRGGQEGHELLVELSPDVIYTGNRALLQHAHDIRLDVPVIETRLDADDGLHQSFIQTIQDHAISEFYPTSQYAKHKQWMYWCVGRHMEWYGTSTNATNATVAAAAEGYLKLRSQKNFCVTPRLTVGYNVGTTNVPVYPHHRLYNAVRDQGGCVTDSSDECIRMLSDPDIAAVRSRTPTSAGMKGAMIVDTKQFLPDQDHLWSVLTQHFNVSKEMSVQVSQHIHANAGEIARDNLHGQCTTGHSCKSTSKKKLMKYLGDNA